MPNKTTTDHDEIRRWVEERGGWPAEVQGTERGAEDTGIIRIDFPGYSGEGKLARIDWDEWFRKFDDAGLAFVYQDATRGGQRSNFNKLVARETAEARGRGEGKASRRSARGGGASARARARGGAARSRKPGGRTAAKTGAARKAGVGRGAAKRTAPKRGTRRAAGGTVARSAGAKRGGSRRGGRRR